MENTKLLNGLFKQSQEKGKKYLVDLDVDRLMAPCYEAVNQTPKKERYGGWEQQSIAGHSLGHWLSAAAVMYHATEDVKLKEKLIYALEEMEKVQSNDPDGYLSGFPRKCFDEVFSGDFEVAHFSLGGSWVPWYSIHKIYAGLIDVYQYTGMEKALQIVLGMADWAYKGLSRLTHDQFQRMLICEFGGMNEVFADLYKITEDLRYLELAEKFYHEAILDPLSEEKDELEGKHANTQIPKVIGVAKLYNITGKEKYRKIAEYFWEQVVKYRTYVIGGNSIREHFGLENTEELGVLTTETCNTYNMLLLTELIFDWNRQAKYYDFYERGLYNHILASQDPESGMKTYFVSSEPGHFKVYHSHDNSFWCCTGTGMENPARYNSRIFQLLDESFYIHLFIPATWKSNRHGMAVKQETDFPYSNRVTLTVEEANGLEMEWRIREPYWLNGEMTITLNGEPLDYTMKDGYVSFVRGWQKGDRIEFHVPMNLHLYRAKDTQYKSALLYGPIVLAGALGRENFPESDILDDHLALNNHPLIEVPSLVANPNNLTEWIEIVDKERLLFETKAIGQPGNRKLKLKPFYDIHHERYTIYWNLMKDEEYKSFVDKDADRKVYLQRITVDQVTPHEQQPEVEHRLLESNSHSDYLNVVHKGYRMAKDNGFFSYEMKVEKDLPMYLAVTYYGSEGTLFEPGGHFVRDFNIKLDGEVIANQIVEFEKPGELFTVNYEIPQELTKNKDSVRVEFAAEANKATASVFEVRIVKEKI
ncbi:hypothetical protein GGQ92_001291 [Gracilibacillus halotolerans]|uniref:Glycoside hydrolase family 127 protein n=1 Tax=Gracilibacillus halotolerans TaxID=74386 RepID=A0A841RPC7_9BACI|nr:hypothetical protein [Gracilibacillus halotolerans]